MNQYVLLLNDNICGMHENQQLFERLREYMQAKRGLIGNYVIREATQQEISDFYYLTEDN